MQSRDQSNPRRVCSGIKALISVGAVAVTLGGWATLAGSTATQQPVALASPPPSWISAAPDLPPLPTLVPIAGAAPIAGAPLPAPAAPGLRQNNVPPVPITTTRSSR